MTRQTPAAVTMACVVLLSCISCATSDGDDSSGTSAATATANPTSFTPVAGEAAINVENAFAEFSELRNIAELLAVDAKSKFATNAAQLELSRQLYNAAFAKGNAFIDAVQLAVTQRKKKVKFQKEAKELGNAVKSLNDAVNPPVICDHCASTAISVALPIAGVIEGVAKGGTAIWKEYRAAQKEIVDEVKAEMDKRRWKSWSQIGS